MTKIRKQFIWGLIFLLTGSVAQADVVTMLTGSQGGHNWGTQASYTSGGNTVYYWSNHEAVTAGNDYYVSGKGLRTPDTGNNETFPGDALYMGYSGVETVGSGSSLVIKSTGVTINNLNYYGGTITNAKAQHATVTLYGALSTAGNITLASNGDTNSKIGDARTLVINSTITGASNFTISTSTIPYTGLTKNSSVQITGDNSNFSGSWTVNSGAYFYANSATALGTGSVANNGNMYVTVASDYSAGKAWTNNATGVLNLSVDTTVSSLTNKNGGKINLTSGADLTVGALTVNYASTGSAVDFVLPNQTTAITTQGQKDALAVVGISVADNNSTLKVPAAQETPKPGIYPVSQRNLSVGTAIVGLLLKAALQKRG